jgi:hypothetical protein
VNIFQRFILCADGAGCNTVDIFNVITSDWSAAAFSVPRARLAAASLPDHALAIFAGGLSCMWLVYYWYLFA